MNKLRSILGVTVLAGALAACGGGSGGSVDDDTTNLPEPRPQAIVSGVAFDGLIIGGTVEVFDFTGGTKGQKLGSDITDGSGLYSITLSTSDKPILIEISGGYYIEEATGKQIQVDKSQGHKLLAIEYYESGRPIEVSATFFSTVATGYAEYLIGQGMGAETAIERAYQQVDAWAGFNTRITVPLAVDKSENVTPFLTNGHSYGFVSAAISELTRVAGAETPNGEHNYYSSILFILSAYKDIKYDGILDGRTENGAVSFANLNINANTYRDLVALRMLQFVQSDRNETGLSFDEILPFASSYNLFSDEIFGYVDAPDITLAEPTVSQFLPAEGETISGGYGASAIVSDDYGLATVEYFVDGQFVAGANPNNPARNIDTFNFTNGAHTMTIVVTNVMGNSVSETHNITINNGSLAFQVSGSYSYTVDDIASIPPACDVPIKVTDTTGLGVDMLTIDETNTLLNRASLPSGSVTVTAQGLSVANHGDGGNIRLEQNHCRIHLAFAKDNLGGEYEFGVRVNRRTYRNRDCGSGFCRTSYYDVTCSYSVGRAC